MKKAIFTLVLFASSLCVFAQNDKVSLKIKNGTNPPTITGSIDGDKQAQPLIVLDGTIVDNTKNELIRERIKIAPEDIASIDVLKGEKATMIYGEKGKDGVIVVVSKKYKALQEKTNIEIKKNTEGMKN